MTAQVYDTLAKTLAQVRKDYGADVLESRRRLNGVLADRMPDNKREIRVLLDAVDDGALSTFESTSSDQVGMQIDRLASVMESQRGTRLDLARQVIAACAYAVGVGKLPSELYGAAAPKLAAADNEPDDWVGVSEVVGGGQSTQTGSTTGSGGPAFMDQAKAWLEENKLAVSAVLGVLVVITAIMQSGMFDGAGGGGDQVQVSFPQYDPDLGYYGELADFNVPPQTNLASELNGMVPMTLPGGDVVTTQALIDQGIDDSFVLIDVWGEPHPQGLPNAYNFPEHGQPGNFNDEAQALVVQDLSDITQGRKDFPIVYYTKNVARWDAYNAGLRALNAGYLNVFWYRGGFESFVAAGQGTVPNNSQE